MFKLLGKLTRSDPHGDYESLQSTTVSRCACSYKLLVLEKHVDDVKIIFNPENPEESVATYLLGHVLGKGKCSFVYKHNPDITAPLPVVVATSWQANAPHAGYEVHFNCSKGLSPLRCACGIDTTNEDGVEEQEGDDTFMINCMLGLIKEKLEFLNTITDGTSKTWNMSRSYIVYVKYIAMAVEAAEEAAEAEEAEEAAEAADVPEAAAEAPPPPYSSLTLVEEAN